ncbi:RNA polymerase sigma factor [Zunongwangia sp.]|uniref:RNA polymerase sigma factor n=1 Tax=Zunongwangia sp. TaxID=1965325 RepID=UPI003AA9318D
MSEDFYNSQILPYKGILIKLCRAYTDNQEVCLQVWKSHKRFKQQCKWSSWVYRITLNVCMTMLKKHKSQLNIKKNTIASIDITEPSVFEDEELQLLYAAIQKLPELDKAIIVLYLESKSYKEIANITGFTISAIGVRINRIKIKLKTIIYGK